MNVNVLQDSQSRMMTELKVDHFNKSVMKGKKANDEIQKDMFLTLLITELKNQNPLDPMKDRDFIAQMAQLTSLEKMEKVREGMDLMVEKTATNSLYSMLGKKVSFYNDKGQPEEGAVEAIEFKDGQGYIQVNQNLIHPKYISRVE